MQVPESMKSTWENIKVTNQATGNITQEQLTQLGDAANADGTVDNQEKEFLSYVESNFMASSSTNEGKASKPVEFVDPQFGKVPTSMVETWKKVSADGVVSEDELQELKNAGIKDDGKADTEEFNFLKTLVDNSQDGFLSLNQNKSTSSSTPFGQVPTTLQAVWNKVSADGEISGQDLDELILAAAPNEDASKIDDQEREFLLNIKTALENNNGNSVSTAGISSSSSSSGPTLLNWPGYNTQTKQALRDAYGDLSIGTKMPLLRADAASEVANNFGVSNVRELQSMIGAKVDGKFGPETYFKAKAFVANLMNTNPQDPRIANMLSVLGNDAEAQKMRENFTNSSTPTNNPNDVKNDNPQVNTEKPPVSIGDTDPNNPESVKSFQSKVNLLSSLYNQQKGANFESVEPDGQLSEPFADKLRNMEQTIGKPVAQAIAEIENELKSKGFSSLNSKSVDFVKLTDTGIQITGEPKDMTRVNAAKELLAKLGFNITNFEISKPQDPSKNGDLILKSGNFELAVFDNISVDKRDHNNYGDIHIVGKYDNKNIDVSYWENDRRGPESIKKHNRFHLKTVVDGKELEPIKQNESILSKPLIAVK